ncbi:MAG: U32 family peptidase [Phycisphaerae bacterium]|nr:U32 family peptidase [Phycisphaerae bacterium]
MTELLAPVRDEISFRAAIEAGADAVYFGLGHLNMRVNSKGIDPDMLEEIVGEAHSKDVKVYVTLNAVIFDEEIETVDKLLGQCKQASIDAIICWDPAVIELAQKHDIEIHISTQASISNARAANYYKTLGATRIVPARELSLEQIKTLKANSNVEVEVFVHGAMCVSVSGRCFMSQFLENRSANRGDCLQPCRANYKVTNTETGSELEVSNGYVMSPKDLCGLPVLDEILATGVDALKIEGRSRSPEYIKMVVSVYRRAIDAIEAGKFDEALVEELMADLKKVYNRGFSDGFLHGRPGPQQWADRRNSQATEKKLFVGKLINFFRNTNIAHCKISSGVLKTGDRVQIHGFKTGVYEMVMGEMRDDDSNVVTEMSKGNVTFHSEKVIRRNDQVYKIVPVDA